MAAPAAAATEADSAMEQPSEVDGDRLRQLQGEVREQTFIFPATETSAT